MLYRFYDRSIKSLHLSIKLRMVRRRDHVGHAESLAYKLEEIGYELRPIVW